MHCPYCGKEISENAKVCPYCGREQKRKGAEPVSHKSLTNDNQKGRSRFSINDTPSVESSQTRKFLTQRIFPAVIMYSIGTLLLAASFGTIFLGLVLALPWALSGYIVGFNFKGWIFVFASVFLAWLFPFVF